MQTDELVMEITKALVDKPDQVVVTQILGRESTILEVSVDPSDLGKIIGKEGRNARCIRTLLNAVGMKEKRRFTLEILE
jgi:predicted RNA-binding protein YlqC (UPF0109 family)